MSDCNNNCVNPDLGNFNEVKLTAELLDRMQYDQGYCYDEVKENRVQEGTIEQFDFIDKYCDIKLKDHTLTHNETLCKIPNILKNNSNLHKVLESETKWPVKDIKNKGRKVQVSLTPTVLSTHATLENICVKKESKHRRVSQKRKQKHTFVEVWHELPKWRVSSSIGNKKGVSDTCFFVPAKLACLQEEKVKYRIRKQNKKQKVSAVKDKQEDALLPQIPENILSEFVPDYQAGSSFIQETGSNDFHDPIDFSSNDIFNMFKYEFYGSNSTDYSPWCMMGSSEPFSSLDTDYDFDIHVKNNTNDYDTATCFCPDGSKHIECTGAMQQFFIPSECLNQDVLSLFNEKPNSCCSFCNEDCVSNWIMTNRMQDNFHAKDKLLTATVKQHSEINLGKSYVHGTVPETYLIDDALGKEEIDFPLVEFFHYSNLKNIYAEEYREPFQLKLEEVCSVSSDSNSTFDFNEISDMYGEEIKDFCDIEIPKIEATDEDSTKKEEFQCSSCPLTFSNSRTMAIHQPAAHGGTYIILCQSCGRLFNRKYHFNRHFIYCARVREPFACDMCIKKYRHKSSLVHHLKVKHHVYYSRSRSSAFTCSVCKKVYSKFGAFENHVKSHKNNW